MRTHGFIMLLLAVAITYTIHEEKDKAKWVMWAVTIYSVIVTFAVIWGWKVSGEITWSAPSKWIFVFWASLALQLKIDEYGRALKKGD